MRLFVMAVVAITMVHKWLEYSPDVSCPCGSRVKAFMSARYEGIIAKQAK